MRTIIAGSRGDYHNIILIEKAVVAAGWRPIVVLSGTAWGIDQLGERWAAANDIPVERYPADWQTYGKSAGYRRNTQMADLAEAAILLWDGTSRGTAHMRDIMLAKHKSVFVFDL